MKYISQQFNNWNDQSEIESELQNLILNHQVALIPNLDLKNVFTLID